MIFGRNIQIKILSYTVSKFARFLLRHSVLHFRKKGFEKLMHALNSRKSTYDPNHGLKLSWIWVLKFKLRRVELLMKLHLKSYGMSLVVWDHALEKYVGWWATFISNASVTF